MMSRVYCSDAKIIENTWSHHYNTFINQRYSSRIRLAEKSNLMSRPSIQMTFLLVDTRDLSIFLETANDFKDSICFE